MVHCKAADTLYIGKWLSAQFLDWMVAPFVALHGRLPRDPIRLIAVPGPWLAVGSLLACVRRQHYLCVIESLKVNVKTRALELIHVRVS